MKEIYTHTKLMQLQHVPALGGDLLLLPREERTPFEEGRALQVAGMLPLETSILYEMMTHMPEVQARYAEHFSRTGREPEWMSEYPMSTQKTMRVHYALTEEDPLAIVPFLPYTGIRYMVRDGGLCAAVCRAFNLFRLEHINQLGFLQSPWCAEIVMRMPLTHGTRYLHSLDVMAVATLIAHNLRLPQRMYNTLRVAALTHDIGTPAGGDSVKLIDPTALDEDANYERIIGAYDWRDVKKQYDVDEALLIRTVQNQGLLGQILDVADKIAYIARDLGMCLHHIEHGVREGVHSIRTLRDLITDFPFACSLWDVFAFRHNKLVCTEPARLGAFLKIRTLMFRELYYNPISRAGEFIASLVLVQALYKSGKVTRETLLSMNDYELQKLVDQTYGLHSAINAFAGDKARYATFKTREEAEAFERTLRSSGNSFVLLEDYRKSIKTGTHMLVEKEGIVMSFAEAYPSDAREIEEMAALPPMVHVYYINGEPDMPAEAVRKIKKDLSTSPSR